MIFYFSSTGNSLYAAQKLAERVQTGFISMAEVINSTVEKHVFRAADDEVIGFVIPVYFCGLPAIVTQFLSKVRFENMEGHYLFLVQTYGAMAGNAAALFQKELTKHGLQLSAAYSICTIDSYLPVFELPEEKEASAVLQKADEQLTQICASVIQHQTNEKMKAQGAGASLASKLMQRMYRKGRRTAMFTVGPDCTGCGLCSHVCPCDAIRIENQRPVWSKDHCTLCLGCVHRCPVQMIEYGKKTKGKARYTNPDIEFPDNYL